MHELTLLYAEDDQETRENYAFVLKQYFNEVYSAKDGKEALELYKNMIVKNLSFSIPLILIVGINAKEIISFLFTNKYHKPK